MDVLLKIPKNIVIFEPDSETMCGIVEFKSWSLRLLNHPAWGANYAAGVSARILCALLKNAKEEQEIVFNKDELTRLLETAENPRYVEIVDGQKLEHSGYQGYLPMVSWQCTPFVDAIRSAIVATESNP